MRKRVFPILLQSLVLLVAAVPQSALFERIRERGEVVFVTQDDDCRPFLYQQGNSWEGIELPYIECISRAVGVPWSVVVQTSPEECLRMLEDGEADVFVGGRRITTGEAMYLDFSEPFASLKCYLVVNRLFGASLQKRIDRSLLDTFRDAGSPRVGAVTRYSQWALEPEFKPEVTNRYESYTAMIRDLEAGLIDVCVMDRIEYEGFMKDRTERLLYFRPLRLEHAESVGFAVSWKNSEMLRLINIALRATISADNGGPRGK